MTRLQSLISKTLTAAIALLLSTTAAHSQIEDELTAYWTFDNTLEDQAGDFEDSANTTNDNLTFQGSGSTFGTGLFGGSYSGDSNGYAEALDSNDLDPGNNSISISTWIKVTNFNQNWQAVIAKGEGDNYRIARRANLSTLSFSGGSDDINSNTNVEDNTWHHVVGVAGPSGSHFYLDGILVGTDNNPATLINSFNALWIGNNPDLPNREWNGEIDDIGLWHRELTANDVTAIFNAGQAGESLAELINPSPPSPVSPFSNELTAYWTFDSTLSNQVIDQAGSISGSANTTDNNLTFQGTGTQLGEGLFGAAGYTSNGNGYASTVDSDDVDAVNNTISISVWARVENFDRAWQTILSKGEEENYRISRLQRSNFINANVGGSDLSSAPTEIGNGAWHHIAATAGPSGSFLYIDGNLVPESSTAPSVLSNEGTEFWVGNNPQANGRQWEGDIDDLAIWNRELSPSEITSIYAAGSDTQNPQSLSELIDATGNSDSDNDGLPDVWEFTFDLSFDPATGALGDDGASGDPDGDLLSNLDEFLSGTSPILSDTDGDGLLDQDELLTYNTEPTLADSDNDGSSDGEEVFLGSNPIDQTSTPSPGQTTAGLTNVGSLGPYLDGALPSLTPTGGNSIGENWITPVAFPGLTFGILKGVVSEPRSTHIYAIERAGRLQRVDISNPTSTTQVFDINDRIVEGDNGGLRSVVFHPEFNLAGSPNRNYLYCFYSTEAEISHGFTNGDGEFFYRLSRFTRDEATGNFPSSSELVLIQQRSRDEGQHFGGSLGFDSDGFLIIGWGDMEFSNDRVEVPFHQDVQRVDRIFQGAILRIDVDMRGGSVSSPPTRTLQGSSGPNAVPGSSQSCPLDHPYYHPDNLSGLSYFIPSDNYFVLNPPAPGNGSFADTPLHGDALQEHMGLGTRNPWRLAVDPIDGDIALFNVGANAGANFEEVELISQGYNGGWPYLEGETSQTSETGLTAPPSQYAPTALGNETLPIAYWDHTTGRVASGGLFYRGAQWPSLNGQLLFADHSGNQIWALDYKNAGPPNSTYVETDGVNVPSNYTVRELLDTNNVIRQMAAGPNGENIYIATANNIRILINLNTPNPEPPTLLSQTGAFTDLATLTPRAGLIPFEPASPLWSDRTAKQRWIGVPNTDGITGEYDQESEKITYSSDSEWAYPIGTVFIKNFAAPLDLRDEGNPANLLNLETRFLVRGETGDYFYFTYRWLEDGSDAVLVSQGTETRTFAITNSDGTPSTQTWDFPSRGQCVECHQPNSGDVLGMKSRQLNHELFYPSSGNTANQLTTFANLGLFDQGPNFSTLASELKSVNIDDVSASWEERVRSYLDSNCSYCHRPGSAADRAEFDALLTTPLPLSGILNGELFAGQLGADDPRIVTPGSPERSVLFLRDSSTNPGIMMPPIGRRLTDENYISVLEAWIETIGFTEYIAWAGTQGIDSGLTADEDNDGLANVFEFVFLQNGNSPDISTLPEIVINSQTQPTIDIPVSGAALTDGFEVTVQGSVDLINWFDYPDPQSGLEVVSDTSAPGTDGTLRIRVTSGSDRHFLRYGVVTP